MNISIGDLIKSLGEIRDHHSPSSITYGIYSKLASEIFKNTTFKDTHKNVEKIDGFGEIYFPMIQMGSVSSYDVFSSLNELIIFAFYLKNKRTYKKALDIGANIGLHSIMMGKLGWKVESYEPDPKHFKILMQNLEANGLGSLVRASLSAVSNKNGKSSFVRVLGNTTSSHLEGSKANAYGSLEKIEVDLSDIKNLVHDVDFIKIDAEGHEGTIICNIPKDQFSKIDVMVEIGSKKNAVDIYKYTQDINLNLFSQKNGWNLVNQIDDVPFHYKEGSLFISKKREMGWF